MSKFFPADGRGAIPNRLYSMQSLVSFKNVIAVSGNFPVLTGFDVEIGPSEIVLLRGRNGAGKTSFLRAVAGLLRVTRGQAKVLGVDVVARPADVRQRVGFLGHESFLYEDLTARENVKFVLRATRSDTNLLDSALDAVGLGGRLSSLKVSKMSAGQKKKVALASLIARAPELWLLDEPHTSLDSWTRGVLDATLNLAVEHGSTVLLVSHEAHHGSLMPSRIIDVAGGKVGGDTVVNETNSKKVLLSKGGSGNVA